MDYVLRGVTYYIALSVVYCLWYTVRCRMQFISYCKQEINKHLTNFLKSICVDLNFLV